MSVIPPRSVDFLFDTVGVSMAYLSLMRAKTGTIISISTTPSGDLLQNSSVTKRPPDGRETAIVPTHIRWVLNMIYRIRKARAWYWSVNYSYLFLHPNGEDLDSIRQLIEEGKLRTVVGTTAHFKDLKAVRDTCQVVYDGKGGVGKSVILFE
jgi:NADPH:quinone reductase-like Zn-dependent oxidoreductase